MEERQERRRDYSELVTFIEEALESLHVRDSDVALNVERLEVLLATTHEIKEQLLVMNGRVRENEKDLAAIKTNPGTVMRSYCDERRSDLDRRMRVLEGRVPSIIQNFATAIITGGVMALAYHFLSKLP